MLITHEIDLLKAKTLLRLACKKFDQFFFPVNNYCCYFPLHCKDDFGRERDLLSEVLICTAE